MNFEELRYWHEQQKINTSADLEQYRHMAADRRASPYTRREYFRKADAAAQLIKFHDKAIELLKSIGTFQQVGI